MLQCCLGSFLSNHDLKPWHTPQYKHRKNDRRSGRGKSVTEHDGHFAVYDGLWDDDMRSGQVNIMGCEKIINM